MTDDLRLDAYDYTVPKELIAQEPLARRDASNLLVLRRDTGAIEHRRFADIVSCLDPGDCVVVNRSRVVPVRLFGKKETGGSVEVLFLDPREFSCGTVRALSKPPLERGRSIHFEGGLTATVSGRTAQGETVLSCAGDALAELVEKEGRMPLPPYIKRDKGGDGRSAEDHRRYQTVYAREKGSIAAPTAGLHFTDDLLAALRAKGVTVAEVTLHVGWGTFRPVTASTVSEHTMLPERYELTDETAAAINAARAARRRVVAVGTTSVRTLESVPRDDGGALRAAAGETTLFIHPGFAFKVVTALVTNFHQPQSTPLMLTAAFAGRERLLAAYRAAIDRKYRFFSYGDAMLVL